MIVLGLALFSPWWEIRDWAGECREVFPMSSQFQEGNASLPSQSSAVYDSQFKFFTVALNYFCPSDLIFSTFPLIYWIKASLTSFSPSTICLSLTPGLKSPEILKTGTFLAFKSPIRYHLLREDVRTF